MEDRHTHVCHRLEAAKATGCRQASQRGHDFRPYGETPIALRALAECSRPRSLVILAVMAGVMAMFWIS